MCSSAAGLYRRRIAPWLVHVACSGRTFRRMRAQIVPLGAGTIVDVGCGSGTNFAHHDAARAARVIAVDPAASALAMARRRAARLPFAVDFVEAGAERLPLETASADTAILAYTLCTVPEPAEALAEIRRVLKPGGRLLFLEHGVSDRPRAAAFQRRLNRAWGVVAAGCHLTRSPERLIAEAGFAVTELHRAPFPLWLWPLGLHHGGYAVPR